MIYIVAVSPKHMHHMSLLSLFFGYSLSCIVTPSPHCHGDAYSPTPLCRQNVPTDWHGHVTALTVHPNFRRLGLAAKLMSTLENISDRRKCYFVDLFVRVSNTVAVQMYKNLGYIVYRKIVGYYSAPPGSNMDNEDAYDMRRALKMDKEGKSVIPITEPVPADEVT